METNHEENWKAGIHVGSNGKEVAIESMATTHLQNTEAKYAGLGYDTTPLKEELAKRNGDAGAEA